MRVLLVANHIPGPVAGFLLCHLGADVIKVEPPLGDPLRQSPPFFVSPGLPPESAYFRAMNGGFRSVAVDLKSEAGVGVLRDLIRKSDVLIDGYRPGYLVRVLGARPGDLQPTLVHIPITAHGLKGPRRDHAGHDNNVLAQAGNLSYGDLRGDGAPAICGQQVADITAGYLAAFQAVAFLFGRRNPHSKAQISTIDVSTPHAAFSLNQIYVTGISATGRSPQPGRERLNGALPNYRTYETQDRKPVFFGPIEPSLLRNFLASVGRVELSTLLHTDDDRLATEIATIFASRSLAEWRQVLEDVDCCFTPIESLEEAMASPQIQALGLVPSFSDGSKRTGYPAGFTQDSLPPAGLEKLAPKIGEHSRAILAEVLEYDSQKIEGLFEAGAVIAPRGAR